MYIQYVYFSIFPVQKKEFLRIKSKVNLHLCHIKKEFLIRMNRLGTLKLPAAANNNCSLANNGASMRHAGLFY